MRSQPASYHGYRFPPDIMSHAVWLYHRFCLSFRDAEDLLAQRGVTVTYETIRQWCQLWVANYYSARNPLRLSSLVILGVVARMFRCATRSSCWCT